MEDDNLFEKMYEEYEPRLAFINGVAYVSLVNGCLTIVYKSKGVNVLLLESNVLGVFDGKRVPYRLVPENPESKLSELGRNSTLLDF
jgi:hypothetical protein